MNALRAEPLPLFFLCRRIGHHIRRLAAGLLLLLCLPAITSHAEAADKAATIGKIARIDMGVEHSCAVTVEGALWCWGKNTYGQVGAGKLGEEVSAPARIFAHGVSSWVFRPIVTAHSGLS